MTQYGDSRSELIAVIHEVRKRWRRKIALRGGAVAAGCIAVALILSAFALQWLRFTQQSILGFKVLCPFERVAELDLGAENTHQPLVFPWFLYEIASPAAHGLNRDVDASPGRHHDHGQSAVKCLDFREQRQTFFA